MPFLSKHVKDIHQLMSPKSQGLCFTSHTQKLNPSFCFSNPFIEKEEKVLKDGCRPGVKRNFNSHSGTLEGASNMPSFLHPSSRVT